MCRCCEDDAMHALYLETIPRRPPIPGPLVPVTDLEAARNRRQLKAATEREAS